MTHAPTEARARLIAIALMVATVTIFPVMDSMAKHLGKTYPIPEVVWARYAFHMIFVGALFARRDALRYLKSRNPRLQLLRAVLILCATGLFFTALRFVPLADCIAINFMAPLLAVGFSIPLLGEKVERHRWVVLAIGFVAVLVIVRPGFAGFHPASLLVCVSAACYGMYQIITRKLASFDHPLTTLFYTGAVGTLIAGLALPFLWVAPDWRDWALMATMGLLGGLSHYLLIQAYARASPAILAPFSYCQIIVGTALGYLWFGDFPDELTALGATAIVGCGLYLVWREARGRDDKVRRGG